MGLGSSVGNEAAKILGQINAEMLQSSEALKNKAKSMVRSETLEATKQMIQSAAPTSKLDASQMQVAPMTHLDMCWTTGALRVKKLHSV